MSYNILTSFNESYWNEVAKETCLDLDKNWIKGSSILFYHELSNSVLSASAAEFSNRVKWVDLYKETPIQEFVTKWKFHPKANGEIKGFRNNAVKFVHKTFAIWHAAKQQKTGWLIWLDCDAIVRKQIDKEFEKRVFKDNIVVSYVGRPGKYSECGFLAFNLDNPKTHEFLNQWEELYVSGKFVELKETHDSWTFDYIRLEWDTPELFYDLNRNTKTNKNPFNNSDIGPYFLHAKGDGKKQQANKLKKYKHHD